MKKQLLELRVNGRTHELAIEPNRLLLDALRVDLQLTGSKRGCDDSSCGACTVLVDGTPMLSCTMLAASCEGEEIPLSKASVNTERWPPSRRPTATGEVRSAA